MYEAVALQFLQVLAEGLVLHLPQIPRHLLNVLADEKILDDEGTIDIKKIHPFLFDQVSFDYFEVGEICGKAWHSRIKD